MVTLKFKFIDTVGVSQEVSLTKDFSFNINLSVETGIPEKINISEMTNSVYGEDIGLKQLIQQLYGAYNLQIYFVESIVQAESLLFEANEFSLPGCSIRLINAGDYDSNSVAPSYPLVTTLEVEKL